MFRPLLFVSNGYLISMVIWVVGLGFAFRELLKWRQRTLRTTVSRGWLNSLSLSVWFAAATLTAVELGFAWLCDTTDSFAISNVSQRWFELHVTRNDGGFRDATPFPRHPPEGRQRLCFLGDSFTFGHGIRRVEDRFSDRVAAALERRSPGQFAVSNLAEPGLATVNQTKLINQVAGQGYELGTVIYVFCFNDIETFYEDSASQFWGRRHLEPKVFLFRDTYFFNFAYYRVQLLTHPQLADYSTWLEAAYSGEPWEQLAAEFDRLREACRLNKAQLRVVLFPFMQGLKQPDSMKLIHQRVWQYWQQKNVPCLDLLPAFESHADEPLSVNAFDAHPNERAHAIAAELIVSDLTSR